MKLLPKMYKIPKMFPNYDIFHPFTQQCKTMAESDGNGELLPQARSVLQTVFLGTYHLLLCSRSVYHNMSQPTNLAWLSSSFPNFSLILIYKQSDHHDLDWALDRHQPSPWWSTSREFCPFSNLQNTRFTTWKIPKIHFHKFPRDLPQSLKLFLQNDFTF